MSGVAHILLAIFAAARNRVPRWRAAVLITSLTLLLVSSAAAGAVPALAAPAADTIKKVLNLNIRMDDSPLCANRDYPVVVILTSTETAIDSDGNKHELIPYHPLVAAVPIEAFTQDPSVASVAPKTVVSGFDVEDPIPNAARFSLHTGKAGSTSLIFETIVQGQYFGPVVPIKVINCKYKVSVTTRGSGSYNDATSFDIAKVEGEMTADKDGNLTGSATGNWDLHAFSSCNSHSVTISAPPTVDLTGLVSSDGSSLSIHVSFSSFSVTDSSRTCPVPFVGVITGSGTADAQISPVDVDLSASGAVKTKTISITFGPNKLQGSAVISVMPLEGN